MNKQSTIFIVIGVLVLAGLGYLVLKPDPKEGVITQNQQVNTETSIETEQPDQSIEVDEVFKYTLNGYEPRSIRVEQGQQVYLRIISEVADEAHLHGYDLSKPLVVGEESVIAFTADKTGRFDLELHNLEKPLGVIEVHPK